MKMQVLKKRVKHIWEVLNTYRGAVTAPESAYITEIKSYGDRRYKKTWVAALARLEAALSYEGCIDSYSLILYDFNFTPDRVDYEYRHQILDEFLMYPDGLDLIKQGLEQIFASTTFTATEQQETRRNGFFELLGERETQSRGTSIPTGAIRQLEGAYATA